MELHRAVVTRLRADPDSLERARLRVRSWLEDRSTHPLYARAWSELLAQPFEAVAAALVDPSERMTALRQASPFAGTLDSHERWRILRECAVP